MYSTYDKHLVIFLIFTLILLLCNYVEIKADQEIKIYADEISIDQENEKISAFGNAIAINQNKVRINSDKLIYNRKQKSLKADGNVIINDEILFFLKS